MNAAVAILVWIFTLIVLIVIIGEIRFRQSLKKESNHSYYVRKLDFLGISYRDNSNNLLEGEWRIAIYYEPTTHDFPIGFHISRQDIDGIWSEKPSWEGKIKKIGDKSNIPPNLEKSRLYLKNVLILSKNK